MKRNLGNCLSQVASFLWMFVLCAISLAEAQPASAPPETYPKGIVRIIVPFPPGSGADVTARLIANELSKQWPHPAIVENRPGANTLIGMRQVTTGPADGHVLLYTSDDSFTLVPHLYSDPSVAPVKDLAPVNLSVKVDMLMVANAQASFASFEQMLNVTRAKPGVLSYSSYGLGSTAYLIMEHLKYLAKVDILHVPYRGVSPALEAVLKGDVSLSLTSIGTTREYVATGLLKPLAIVASGRSSQAPDIPTLAELGYPQIDGSVWWGFAAPAATPTKTIETINTAISRALQAPAVQKSIQARTLEVSDIGPKAFAEHIDRLSKIRAAIVPTLKLRID